MTIQGHTVTLHAFQIELQLVLFAAKETPRVLLEQVYSRPPSGNTDGFRYMSLCHKYSGQ